MDKIECMRTFVAVVQANGFSAAGRALDLPRSKVSKQIQALEEMLGVQLFMRTTRSLHLTGPGADYYDAAREIIAALEDAEQRARDGVGKLTGLLRVNAPLSFGLRILGPLLPEFHRTYPQVELQISLTDQLVDPIRGGYDVTIRIASLTDSSLVARPLMPADRVLVAAPSYVARFGVPAHPRELENHAFLSYGHLQGGLTLPLTRGAETIRVNTTGPAGADNGDLLAVLAESGMGITLLPRFIVHEGLKAGSLVPVLEEWSAPAITVCAVYSRAQRVPQKTRKFIDFLVSRLEHWQKANPA